MELETKEKRKKGFHGSRMILIPRVWYGMYRGRYRTGTNQTKRRINFPEVNRIWVLYTTVFSMVSIYVYHAYE